jgi:hypothetical protein
MAQDRDVMRTRDSMLRSFVVAAFVSALATGCHSSRPPAKTAGNCTKMGARTGVAGAKTGVKTGVEGVKTAGGAVGGFFTGGTEGASRKWNEGKANTRNTAHEGAGETSGESHSGDCP